MIITIDGLDGVGKSTVSELLEQKLNATIIKGVRDPYVDKLALNSGFLDVRYLYYLASFIDSILDAKAKTNSIVIYDKSFYSTIAYHRCLGSKIDIEKTITDIVCPNLRIYLTCSRHVWQERLKKRQKLDWYEEQILTQTSLADRIESLYTEMGLVRVVNSNIEETASEIMKLCALSKAK